VIVGVFTFGGSFLIFKITGLITRLRVSPDEERLGLDLSQHSETLQTEAPPRTSGPGKGKMEVAA
jgi:Amt family ammonium transporter